MRKVFVGRVSDMTGARMNNRAKNKKRSKTRRGGSMRRVVLLLVMMAFMLSIASSAFAGGTYGNSIRITKYRMDRIPTEGPEHDGRQKPKPEGAEPVEGISFRIIRVKPMNPQPTGTPTITANGPFYNEQHGEWYEPAPYYEGDTFFDMIRTTDVNGFASTGDIPTGVYYIMELESPKVADPSAPFFVSVPTRINEGGTEIVIRDVYVYPKNEDIGIKKEIVASAPTAPNGKGVSIGDTIQYKLTVDVPTWVADAKVFRAVDQYSKGLLFAGVDEVRWFPKSGGTGTVLPNTAYDVASSINSSGGTVTVDLMKARATLSGQAHRVEILLSLKVTEEALLTEGMENEARLDYTNKWGHEKERESGKPTVYTGGIRGLKHDAVVPSTLLAGAKFVLVPKLSDDFAADAGVIGSDRIPANAYRQNGAVLIATSDANGIFEFKGIPYGSIVAGVYSPTPTPYWLVEIEAPGGYRIPGGTPVVIEISESSWLAGVAGPSLDLKVGNVKGFNFPLTGGTGTVAFFVIAFVLVGMSFNFYQMSKKRPHHA